ncbi:hypothetical protein CRG98_012505 [Punica granatum]|uniref:Uncharacterized protein n=1 Tax=Punica granatum TaxID=22663 RepID=A0A2I0KF05_PUNGR|nr:hypothetical protein CRG98_012505 [Punica granatum]
MAPTHHSHHHRRRSPPNLLPEPLIDLSRPVSARRGGPVRTLTREPHQDEAPRGHPGFALGLREQGDHGRRSLYPTARLVVDRRPREGL